MKNRIFPNSDEWDKIVNEAFSSDEIHIFSEKYNLRKEELLPRYRQKEELMKRNRIKPHKRFIAPIAAAAAAVIIIPATVYAYTHINANIIQTAPYENTVQINNSANEELSDEIMKPEFNWLPEDLIYNEDGPYGGKFKNSADGGMTPVFYKAPEGGIHENLLFSDHSEQYDHDDKTIMINYRISYDEEKADSNNFGREVWIYFNGTKYAEQLYFTDDISNDDVKKIAENIVLVPSDTEVAAEWFDRTESNADETHGHIYNVGYNVDLDKINFYHIGDTFVNDLLKIKQDDGYYDIRTEITLNNVWIQDNFNGITTDGSGFDRDYSEYTDENGNLLTGERSWYTIGNGSTTLNEVIKTEPVKKHILVMDLTYTNITDSDLDKCIAPEMYTSIEGLLFPVGYVPYEDADDISDTVTVSYDRGRHFSFKTDKPGGKNHVILAPGESAQVQLAFEIDDDNIGNLWFCADSYNSNNAMDNFYGSPMVDLCDVK